MLQTRQFAAIIPAAEINAGGFTGIAFCTALMGKDEQKEFAPIKEMKDKSTLKRKIEF